jgi:molecular chaperone GrpE
VILLKDKSFKVSDFFKKKGNDKSEPKPIYHREEDSEDQTIYDQESDVQNDYSRTPLEEQYNENAGETVNNEDTRNHTMRSGEKVDAFMENAADTEEGIPFPQNEPIHNYETEKEEVATTFEAASEYGNFTTTDSEKDEIIERLKGTILKLEDENIIIPALKAEVKRLKEEVEELKQEKNNQADLTNDQNGSLDENANELTKMVYEGFIKLESQFNNLNKEFTTKLKIDESKEKIIDNLHRELQSYKDDQIKDVVKPLINDLILMADRIRKIVESFEKEEELYPKKLLRILNESIQDIEDILYRQGIEPFSCEDDNFDIKRQQIVKTIKTDDASKDKKVVEVLGKGYEWDGKLFRHEKVNIFVYEKPKA